MKAETLNIRPKYPPELINGCVIEWFQEAGPQIGHWRGVISSSRLTDDTMNAWIIVKKSDGTEGRLPMRISMYQKLEANGATGFVVKRV